MSENMDTPRLLVIGNSCLSNNTSNGRTLRNFLLGWDIEKIAQFYIQNEEPDFSVCRNYFRVTDGQALKAFIKGVNYGGIVKSSSTVKKDAVNNNPVKKHSRNAVSMFLRDFIWNSNRWKNSDFKKWLKEFSPEVVLLQAGDSPFMFKIAMSICKDYNIPLVLYNSEVYYFKNFDYFRSTGIPHLLYPLFHRYYNRVFKKAIRFSHKSIYNCEMIKKVYEKEFNRPSVTIYTATEAQYTVPKKNDDRFTVSYLGNLGVGRHENLVEIGNTLQMISPDYKLDVYGKIPDSVVETAFKNCPGINYRGFVSYDKVMDVMQNSDLLVHIENFSPFYRKDLQYAFSTKIADSLAMGVGFLVYAPAEMACSRYLKENQAAFVVSDKNDLFNTLKYLSENPEECRTYSHTARLLAEKNHNFFNNSALFQNVLKTAASGGEK